MNIKPIDHALSRESSFGRPYCMMQCPRCRDSDFTHTDKIEVIRSGDESGKAWEGRGDLIVLHMYDDCCGHRWEFCIGFHKGQQFLFVRNCAKMTDAEYRTRAREISDVVEPSDALVLPSALAEQRYKTKRLEDGPQPFALTPESVAAGAAAARRGYIARYGTDYED